VLNKRTERIETYVGACKLGPSNRLTGLRCVLRIYQDFLGETPVLKRADGGFENLPNGDAGFAMMGRQPLELDLEDGRRWTVFITDLQGSFVAHPL
jgi:hypothetical protein